MVQAVRDGWAAQAAAPHRCGRACAFSVGGAGDENKLSRARVKQKYLDGGIIDLQAPTPLRAVEASA